MTRHQATFENVATVPTREQNGSVVIRIQDALERSGNAGGEGIVFERGDYGVLVGEVVDEKPDGRKHELARAVNEFGAGKIKSVTLPAAGLEHLEIDDADTEVDVWVCTDAEVDRPLIAVTPVVRQTMQFEIGGGQ